MANPIAFEGKRVDPRQELQRRLDAAPLQHAEALLVAFDVLEEAHSQGLLDMLHGAIGSRNEIFAKLAEYAKEPISTQAMRNLLIMGRLLGSLDPDVLGSIVKGLTPPPDAVNQPASEAAAPSLWALLKRLRSEDARRGLGTVTTLLTGLGKAVR